MVLDDLKEMLEAKYFEKSNKQDLVKKKSQDPGAKCKESYIFQAVARDKAPAQHNFYALPESIGKVDYY